MIREKSLHAIIGLADGYAANGCVLHSVDGSPLAPVTRTSNPLSLEVKDMPVDAFSIPTLSRNRMQDGSVPHDERMEEAVEFTAQVVRNNLKLARTVVNPIVRRAIENIEDKLNRDRQVLAQPVTIVQHHYHKLWDNPLLESMVSRYANSPAFQLERRNGMPKLTAEQIEGHLRLEVSRYDEDLADLVDGHNSEWLEAVYQAAFTTEESDSMIDLGVPPLESILQNARLYSNEIAVVFTLARSFLDNVPEGTTMALDSYRDWMATILSQSGRAVNRVMERRETDIRRKVLIRNWPPMALEFYREEGATIAVNGEVYKRWLEEGGTPEALMGAASTDKESSYQTLLERTEHYEKMWRRQERILSSEVRFDRFNRIVNGIELAIAYEINTYEYEDQDAGDSKKSQQHSALKQCIKELNARQVDEHNLYSTVRGMICKVMFPRTEAERILAAIDSAAEANPGIDVREAAFLAVIEVVSDWVGCQIEVEHY